MIDDKAVLTDMLGRARVPFDVRVIPERWRGKDEVPVKAESEVSVPPHTTSGPRVEFYFSSEGRLITAVGRLGT